MARNVSTAARVSGERAFATKPPGSSRAIEARVRTAPTVGRGRAPGPAGPDRSWTSSQNRWSDVYCAIPIPRANGSEPRLRSFGRQPSMVVSRVTTRASAPAASARRMNESTSVSSVDQ